MASSRFDPGKTEPEKPDSAPPPAEKTVSPAAGAGWKAWLPLLVAVVLMPVLAYAVTNWILLPKLQQGLGLAPAVGQSNASHNKDEPSGKVGKDEKGGKDAASNGREQVAMSKLLVNVAGTLGSRYLLTSMVLSGPGPDLKGRIDRHDPQMRHAAMMILGAKTITDIEKPGSRNLICSELITCFNNVLGAGAVQEIFLTEFAIQ